MKDSFGKFDFLESASGEYTVAIYSLGAEWKFGKRGAAVECRVAERVRCTVECDFFQRCGIAGKSSGDPYPRGMDCDIGE